MISLVQIKKSNEIKFKSVNKNVFFLSMTKTSVRNAQLN